MAPGKSNHFAGNWLGRGFDHDAGADRHGMQRPRHLDHQAAHADNPAIGFDAVELLDLLEQSLQNASLSGNPFGPVLTACLPASLIIASPSLELRHRSP